MILESLIWIFIFLISLIVLTKGADWFVENSEKIALAMKIPPFIIGVSLVAIGTSLPELASSLAAVIKKTPPEAPGLDPTTIVPANAIGSNLANILLIVGLSALVTRKFLAVRRSLIDIDLPLLASTTVLFGFIIWDKKIFWQEGILLLAAFLIYLLYLIYQRGFETEKPIFEEMPTGEIVEVLPSRIERRRTKEKVAKINLKTISFLILGLLFLILGANYLVEATLKIAQIFNINIALISILAIAVGTSLPELAVSVRAAWQKKYEIALGNIFGSNVFNVLVVVGLPAVFKILTVDATTFTLGFPFMAIATSLLIISGITRRISVWEGAFYLLIYILFLVKLFSWF